MDNKKQKPHSADYFGEYRDFWWNSDFLNLIGTRLKLDRNKLILDVGCGIGHWGQLLVDQFSKDAQVIGIDREEEWINQATMRATHKKIADRYRYQIGDATHIPFENDYFDLVTCQTLLIHLNDPSAGLREMLRVLKPEGTLLIAEPNNSANRCVANNISNLLTVEEKLDRMKFDLTVEQGKKALGLGFNSVGDFIPGYLAELGAENIQVYLSDKATPFFSPYSTREQQVNIEQTQEWIQRGFIGWNYDEVLRYFIAGGGTEVEFDRYYHLLLKDEKEKLTAIENGRYHTAGGGIFYLIAAQKKSLTKK